MSNVESIRLPDGTEYNIKDAVTPRVEASQPNLLMNPWFTVNQRGVTSGSPSITTHVFDGWKLSRCVWSLTSSGLSIKWDGVNGTNSYFTQVLEGEDVKGRTVTFSFYVDDVLYSHTFTFPTISDGSYSYNITSDIVLFARGSTSGQFEISLRAYSTTAHIIRAVKLEIGSESTLHLDTAPDYTTELLKCQRYYYVVGGTSGYSSLFVGAGEGSTSIQIAVDLPVPLRTTPTISTSGSFRLIGEGSQTGVLSISAAYTLGNKLFLSVTANSSLTLSKLYLLARQTDCEIKADAEL